MVENHALTEEFKTRKANGTLGGTQMLALLLQKNRSRSGAKFTVSLMAGIRIFG
jgi:hypothetical protein